MTQEDQIERPPASVAAGYFVTAGQRANVRAGPHTGTTPIVSHVEKKQTYSAVCWTFGDTISDRGYISNIWIKLSLKSGGFGYVSAVYLQGDERAGLPASARC